MCMNLTKLVLCGKATFLVAGDIDGASYLSNSITRIVVSLITTPTAS